MNDALINAAAQAEQFGANIRTLRIQSGQSQREIAAALGVTSMTISNLENGKNGPSTELAVRIADFFGMTVNDLWTKNFVLRADQETVPA
jgi:putative transcriptional regulator